MCHYDFLASTGPVACTPARGRDGRFFKHRQCAVNSFLLGAVHFSSVSARPARFSGWWRRSGVAGQGRGEILFKYMDESTLHVAICACAKVLLSASPACPSRVPHLMTAQIRRVLRGDSTR